MVGDIGGLLFPLDRLAESVDLVGADGAGFMVPDRPDASLAEPDEPGDARKRILQLGAGRLGPDQGSDVAARLTQHGGGHVMNLRLG